MSMNQFTPTETRILAGFWNPAKGDVIEGVIVEAWENEFGMSLSLCLTKAATVDQKDFDTGDIVAYEAQPDDLVGINVKAGLRGLEKFVGHSTIIKYLGKQQKKQGSRSVEMHAYDVKTSSERVRTDVKRSSGGATKSGASKSASS